METHEFYELLSPFYHLPEWENYYLFERWLGTQSGVSAEDKVATHLIGYIVGGLTGEFPYFGVEDLNYFLDVHIANELSQMAQLNIDIALQITGFFRIACSEGWVPAYYELFDYNPVSNLYDDPIGTLERSEINFFASHLLPQAYRKKSRHLLRILYTYLRSYHDLFERLKDPNVFDIIQHPLTNLIVSKYFDRDPYTYQTISINKVHDVLSPVLELPIITLRN